MIAQRAADCKVRPAQFGLASSEYLGTHVTPMKQPLNRKRQLLCSTKILIGKRANIRQFIRLKVLLSLDLPVENFQVSI